MFLPDRHGPNDKGAGDRRGAGLARILRHARRPDSSQGRNFASVDTPTSPGVAIVNEALARKYWPDQDPLGKRLRGCAPTTA